MHKMIPLSVLDLCPIVQGGDAAQSFRNTLDLAQHAERWGYRRYWLAEHHGMPGIASAATSVLIGHVASGTRSIRVGAGGIMLPNHSPLLIAEQFGTLASLYPGRIDLGLGRAPGSNAVTARALRRNLSNDADEFPRDVVELMDYFAPNSRNPVHAVPGQGLDVPVWILGSSLFGAQLAAALGLPYAFASHFAPRMLMQAIDLYRSMFQPSATLAKPRVVVGVPLVAASTDDEAQFLASSIFQRVSGIVRGERKSLQPPLAGYLESRDHQERAAIADFLAMAVIGGPATVAEHLKKIAEVTEADELMLVCDIFDTKLRLRSLEIAAAAMSA